MAQTTRQSECGMSVLIATLDREATWIGCHWRCLGFDDFGSAIQEDMAQTTRQSE
jgi:hypothetical protein